MEKLNLSDISRLLTNQHAFPLFSLWAVKKWNSALIGQSGLISSLFRQYMVKKVKYCADWVEWSTWTVAMESSKYYLSGKSAMNLVKYTFSASSSRSSPPSSTSRNTTARHTDFSVFTSQRLLHCTIFLPSCLYYACSVTSLFSVQTLFQVSIWQAG